MSQHSSFCSPSLLGPSCGKTSQGHSASFTFPKLGVRRTGPKGKGTYFRVPEATERCLPACLPVPLPSFAPGAPTPPAELGLLQVLTSFPHPASSPAQACLSPHLSPPLLFHCCLTLAFFSPAPGARGGTPPSLWPMLSSLSRCFPTCSLGFSQDRTSLPLALHQLFSPERV